MDKNKFIESYIYEEVKDSLHINTKEKLRYYAKEKYNYENHMTDLYAKITNYRIKKYGTAIYFIPMKEAAPYITDKDKYEKRRKKREKNNRNINNS